MTLSSHNFVSERDVYKPGYKKLRLINPHAVGPRAVIACPCRSVEEAFLIKEYKPVTDLFSEHVGFN
jgi:hypothetical protein